MIELGIKVKHRYTPFKGLVTGRAEYLNGCQRLLVCSVKLRNDAPLEIWFDDVEMDPISSEKVTAHLSRGGGGLGRTDAKRRQDDDGGGTKQEDDDSEAKEE